MQTRRAKRRSTVASAARACHHAEVHRVMQDPAGLHEERTGARPMNRGECRRHRQIRDRRDRSERSEECNRTSPESTGDAPPCTPGLARLSRLSLWWIRLGIRVERIVPDHREQNGAHEPMHRTLKAEQRALLSRRSNVSRSVSTSSVTSTTMSVLTRRPAGSDRRPSIVHHPVRIPSHPDRIPGSSRDAKDRTQRHDPMAERRIFTSKTLSGEWVGLEEIDDGVWSLYDGTVDRPLRPADDEVLRVTTTCRR